MVVLMQRSRSPMRGRAEIDLKATVDGHQVLYDIPKDAHARWELKGHRPVATTLVPRGHYASKPEPEPTPVPIAHTRTTRRTNIRSDASLVRTKVVLNAWSEALLGDFGYVSLLRNRKSFRQPIIIHREVGG